MGAGYWFGVCWLGEGVTARQYMTPVRGTGEIRRMFADIPAIARVRYVRDARTGRFVSF